MSKAETNMPAGTRRSILGAALALPAIASPAAPTAVNPDAALIADCARWVALEVEMHRITSPWAFTSDDMPAGIHAVWDRLGDEQGEVIDRIAETTPRTYEGMVALAHGLILLGFDMARDGVTAITKEVNEGLTFGLFRALGARTLAEFLREPECPTPAPFAAMPAPITPLGAAYIEALRDEPGGIATAAAMERLRAMQGQLLDAGALA
jgi:hypothetical protein